MKALSTLAVAAVVGLMVLPIAKADDYDKNTKITVNDTIRLPNMTLQPGNYSLRLLDATGNRHVVQVRDENGKGLGFILALPNYRLVPKDKTVITYWETPPGQPRAIRAWFFPGDQFGQEFAYPKDQASQIAGYTGPTLASATTDQSSENDLKTAKVDNEPPAQVSSVPDTSATTTTAQAAPAPAPQPEPQLIAQATPPPAPENPVPAATPAPDTTPAQLPQTGSDLPLIGLIGMLSLAALLMTMPRKSTRISSST